MRPSPRSPGSSLAGPSSSAADDESMREMTTAVEASKNRGGVERIGAEDGDDDLSNPPFLANDVDDEATSTSTSSDASATTTDQAQQHREENDESEEAAAPLSPIMHLPEEMICVVFTFLPSAAAVGRAACVCSLWRDVARGYDEMLWKPKLSRALGSEVAAEAARRELAERDSDGAPSPSPVSLPLSLPLPPWRSAFLSTPAPRCDGLYVSRETYIRTGITEWTVRNPVHVVVYFRYYRFFPPEWRDDDDEKEEGEKGDGGPKPPPPPRGRFWYRTTPETPAKAARSLAVGPPPLSSSSSNGEKNTVVEGRYRLGGGNRDGDGSRRRRDPSMLRTAWRVRNSAGTEVRAKLLLRCSRGKEGAWDRLDVKALASHDLASGLTLPFAQPQRQRENDEDADRGGFPSSTVRPAPTEVGGRLRRQQQQQQPPPLTHTRGLSTFVFLPWHAVDDSPLNLPLSQMDLWIPG